MAGHAERACAFIIIPVQVDTTELFAIPIDVNFLVVVAEALDEMVVMVFADVFDTKVINDETKTDGAPYVASEAPNEVCLSTKDAAFTDGCNSGLHAGKRSEGKVSLPLCSLTIWYYRYALTLHIAEPDPAFSWHSELNTSLGTTTRNHDSVPPKSIPSP